MPAPLSIDIRQRIIAAYEAKGGERIDHATSCVPAQAQRQKKH